MTEAERKHVGELQGEVYEIQAQIRGLGALLARAEDENPDWDEDLIAAQVIARTVDSCAHDLARRMDWMVLERDAAEASKEGARNAT